ncbi:hypothetical protein L6452_19311 [Arctium lappa]|uniref:Uncharacterized protein n=1 Tax=Arctium lappa TaxID=4217 RepID=A0ACB9B916_ARCLA|nr:hypothetical protein L6452_19311 [Arctium lappa]
MREATNMYKKHTIVYELSRIPLILTFHPFTSIALRVANLGFIDLENIKSKWVLWNLKVWKWNMDFSIKVRGSESGVYGFSCEVEVSRGGAAVVGFLFAMEEIEEVEVVTLELVMSSVMVDAEEVDAASNDNDLRLIIFFVLQTLMKVGKKVSQR